MYLALAGDVAGRRILDAGCGVAPPFEVLRDRRAVVTGIDKSAGMLQFRERFRVISGQLGTRIEDVERILVAGQEAVAMAGAAHDWWNAGEDEAQVLIEISRGRWGLTAQPGRPRQDQHATSVPLAVVLPCGEPAFGERAEGR